MRTCSTGGARSAGLKAKLTGWSQSAASDNPLASISKEMEAEMRESVGLRCATNYGAIRLVAVSVWNEM